MNKIDKTTLAVLLIDDDEDDYLITRDLLEEIETQAYHLDWVSTYGEGLAIIDQGYHDVYLIDYRLGERNGLDLLRQAINRGCLAPLILLTGQGDREIDLEATQAGAADYLVKDRLDALLLERSMRYALEQKRTQRALRESEARYRSVSELLADYAFAYQVALDNHLIREWVTDTFVDITGYQPSELEEENGYWAGYQIVHPEDVKKTEAQWQTILAGEKDVCEYRIITKEGEIRWLRVYSYPEWDTDSQRVTYVYGATQDVTEQKQAEVIRQQLSAQLQQAQKMEAIGSLAGGIAHDFNNSLTIIMTCTELLLRRYLDNPVRARQYVEEIKEAGTRAASLVRQLLAFSRKQVLQPQVIDLNILVDDLHKMLKRLIGQRINFITVLSPTLGKIKADPTQLEQVIMNLVINARDAMPQGGELIVETKNLHLPDEYIHHRTGFKSGNYAVLTVSDTGMGMDANTIERIFEPFFTTKAIGKGTGLGLATVYGIVQQSEGQIEVYSEPGFGTTFRVFFPCATPNEIKPLPIEMMGGKETVLVVEREVSVREQVTHILREVGYTVLEARSGKEALHITQVHNSPVDLLLTDIIVSGMKMDELIRQLQVTNPPIRCLCVTGYGYNILVSQKLLEGDIIVLERPFTSVDLLQAVRRGLAK